MDGFDRQRVLLDRLTCPVWVDLGDDAMLNALVIDITTTDKSGLIDPVQRSECRSRKIKSDIVAWRHEEEAMNYAVVARVPPYHPVGIVVPKKNGSDRASRIDREGKRPIAGAEIPM